MIAPVRAGKRSILSCFAKFWRKRRRCERLLSARNEPELRGRERISKPMKLYFLRHADALEGADDAARPLSPQGRKEAQEVGRFLKRAGIEFDSAYSSPLVRARQTAEIVLDLCGSAKLDLTAALLNETSDEEFDVWL